MDYREQQAQAAAVIFDRWTSAVAREELTVPIEDVAPYEPGYFFRRELPCLLAVLAALKQAPQCIIIDGYVWLSDENHPGLGAHLFDAMGRTTPIIGVAKTRFRSATSAVPITRGDSGSPLFITAAGIEVDVAARNIAEMHGPYRIPTLLKRVDSLCRTWNQT